MRILLALLLVVALGSLAGCKKRDAAPAPAPEPEGKGEKPNVVIQPDQPAAPKGGPGKWGTFTVGKTTTFVTGPVEKDGHIDFAAALNERMSKGVTPENNANVGIWKALGPAPAAGGGKVPAGFFDKLGMQPPPATGDYFVALRQHAQAGGPNAVRAALDALVKYCGKPWTVTDDATLSSWLRANEKPMTVVAEAVKKTHYYNPLIPETGANGSKGLFSSLLPGVQACREIANAFACRAMLMIGHNQPAQAWQDLLTCHRLARLIGRGGTLIEGLVGVAIDQIASQGDVIFLDRAKPDAKTVQACTGDLFALPPLPDVVDKIDVGERFTFLDTVMLLDRNGVAHIKGMAEGLGAWPPAIEDDVLAGIDWNPAMERANKWYDRLAAALREPDRATRAKKLSEVEDDLKTLKNGLKPDVLKDTTKPLAERSAVVGDVLVAFLIPAARKVMDGRDRAKQLADSTVVAFACVWYQRFNHKFPAKLADLSPTYLKEVPRDLFNGKELVYKAAELGFEVLSVGPNGIDEGGQSAPVPGFGDDIVIRFPPWVKP